jgi:hypothetical protein
MVVCLGRGVNHGRIRNEHSRKVHRNVGDMFDPFETCNERDTSALSTGAGGDYRPLNFAAR